MQGSRASEMSTKVKKRGWGVLRSAVLGSGDKVQQLRERLAIERALDEAVEENAKSAHRVPRSPKVFNAINSALEVGQASLKTGSSAPSSPAREPTPLTKKTRDALESDTHSLLSPAVPVKDASSKLPDKDSLIATGIDDERE